MYQDGIRWDLRHLPLTGGGANQHQTLGCAVLRLQALLQAL
jgi:hypothetical protein